MSIPTQTLDLFSEGKSVTEVIIILDRSYAEICKYHEDYLSLKNRSYFVSLLVVYLDALPTIVKVVKYLIQNPSTKNDLFTTLGLVEEIPRLRSIKKNLKEKIEYLNETRNHLLNTRRRMNQFSY